MCGIVAASTPLGTEVSVASSLAAIRHRGPDDNGVWIASGRDAHLGHARLAIVDLSPAGHQPMADASGRYLLCYNGEVYNFPELRHALEQRHGSIAWRGHSDSEVIVEGFAREGIPFLDRLNGMFALAIYDTWQRLLHMLRDPIGIKPLFVTEQLGGTWFCSEMKGLLALPGLRFDLRPAALAEQLAYMYVPEPLTPYRQIRKVEPGVCFSYRDGALVRAHRLFDHLQSTTMLCGEDEAVQVLRSAFDAAVRRQTLADVPVSMFLSGGLDSSAVALHAVHSGGKVKDAYTIAFSAEDRRHDAQSDDLGYAQRLADRLGIELKVIAAERDLLGLLPQLVCFMEDGFSDPAAINTYLISAAARRDGVKVLLSGQGADEYLGGYRRYIAERSVAAMPQPLRRLLAATSGLLPAKLPGRLNALNRRLRQLSELAGQSPRNRLRTMYTWLPEATVRGLMREDPGPAAVEAFDACVALNANADVLHTMMAVDQHYDLMSLNLCYTDRMSMAAGVEARVPFLDFDLVRTMNAIPTTLKVRLGQGKYVFKQAMRPVLPREIVCREKAGFGLPIRSWLRERSPLVDHYLDSARLQRQGLFDADAVRRLLDAQFSGRADHSYALFTLLCQQVWMEQAHLG
jgi:asparagine synthase (glutamine-hydrolysing)